MLRLKLISSTSSGIGCSSLLVAWSLESGVVMLPFTLLEEFLLWHLPICSFKCCQESLGIFVQTMLWLTLGRPPQCSGRNCSWAKDLAESRAGLGEAGSCGTKKPLQQELKVPCAPFLDVPPHPGMAPTHRSGWLSSAQGERFLEVQGPRRQKTCCLFF